MSTAGVTRTSMPVARWFVEMGAGGCDLWWRTPAESTPDRRSDPSPATGSRRDAACPTSALRRLDPTHERESVAFGVVEERHPLLNACGLVGEDQVRRAAKPDSTVAESR